ncbi:MAG: DUF6474 family protein [Nakamurella sp.]
MGKRSDAAETRTDSTAQAKADRTISSTASIKADAKSSTRAVRKATQQAEKAARTAEKAALAADKQARKAISADSKSRRAEAKASAKASKAASKASTAAVKASTAAAEAAATKPARLITKLTDPKMAKRAMSIGKILAPALAPVLLKAAVGSRGLLDGQRARKLGVPVEDLGAYRGPTGPAGARITGLSDAIRELGSRKGNDLQVTRFADVASTRLRDLTAAVQACASMPRPKRSEVLHAVSRELDEIDADLVTHLMAPRSRQ